MVEVASDFLLKSQEVAIMSMRSGGGVVLEEVMKQMEGTRKPVVV